MCRALREPLSLCRLKATVSRGGTYEASVAAKGQAALRSLHRTQAPCAQFRTIKGAVDAIGVAKRFGQATETCSLCHAVRDGIKAG